MLWRGCVSYRKGVKKRCGPKLSAAITTPSLNFAAITEVPVTAGDCVTVLGPLQLKYERS